MASPSLWSRLVSALAPIDAKAETGSGVASILAYPQLSSMSRRPERLMAEAEALFHTSPWVGEAERIISGRMGRVAYHLETEDGETISRDDGPLATSLLDALDKPSSEPKRTRRQLWSLTGRHMGLAGNGFWYLDQRELLGGTPAQTLYINPARMTPAESPGGNLLGWIMDHPQNPNTPPGVQATPFELKEIIHFLLDEPDFGHYGIGIPESAYSKVELARLADRQASVTIASGGRLAGILSPPTGGAVISDEGWAAIVRDYRNIVNDPDSAKRIQVIRSPMDFTQTSANPEQMQLKDLLTGSRDDIFALWGIPLSQAGISSARGLNSGEIPKFEEAALWQGPIEERLFGFREKVQTEFVDLWIPLGLKAILILETPTFDDQAPLFENAAKATTLPLTNDERRALVDLDPLEDELLGAMVYIDQTMVPLTVSLGAPRPVTEQPPEPVPTKASPLQTLRQRMEITWQPRIRKVVLAVLSEQRDELAGRIESKHGHLSRKPTDTAVWWNSEKERKRLREAVEPLVLELAREVANRASDKFPVKALDAGYLASLTNFIRQRVGERITSISETTRDDISRLVESGISAGMSPAELGVSIREATAFNEARAEMIARTETMLAYNDAALSTYRELGAGEVQAIDGDADDVCAARDGRTFSVDEAFGISDHPNGTLDWVPIVKTHIITTEEPELKASELQAILEAWGKAQVMGQAPSVIQVQPVVQSPDVHIHVPEQPAPSVSVTVPESVPTPVTVNVPQQPAPVVNMPAAKANGPQEVIVTQMPPREHRVIRKKGEVVGSVETDV